MTGIRARNSRVAKSDRPIFYFARAPYTCCPCTVRIDDLAIQSRNSYTQSRNSYHVPRTFYRVDDCAKAEKPFPEAPRKCLIVDRVLALRLLREHRPKCGY